MSKSIKISNDIYLDTTGIVHEKKLLSEKLDNFKVETGYVSIVAPAQSCVDETITFSTKFTNTPLVFVTLGTGSTSCEFGNISIAVVQGSTTTTGFKIRTFNNDTSERWPQARWFAFTFEG